MDFSLWIESGQHIFPIKREEESHEKEMDRSCVRFARKFGVHAFRKGHGGCGLSPLGRADFLRRTLYRCLNCGWQLMDVGGNEKGQLGNGGYGNSFQLVFDDVVCQTVPIKVMDQVASISCGYEHVAALKKDGSLWMWGFNPDGRLGIGIGGNARTSFDDPYQTVPVKVMDDVAAVSCGTYHTAAIKTDGTLWAWGSNASGQLGNGGIGDVGYDTWEGTYYVQTTPVKVMDDVAAVSCGATHTGIVKTDGTLWMCGNNGSGAVGNGGKGNDTSIIYTYQTVPVQVLSDVAMVQG